MRYIGNNFDPCRLRLCTLSFIVCWVSILFCFSCYVDCKKKIFFLFCFFFWMAFKYCVYVAMYYTHFILYAHIRDGRVLWVHAFSSFSCDSNDLAVFHIHNVSWRCLLGISFEYMHFVCGIVFVRSVASNAALVNHIKIFVWITLNYAFL